MLEKSRKEIDEIDQQILELVAARLKICRKIGEYKRKNNLPVQNQQREKELIQDRAEIFQDLGFDDQLFVQELFELIMKKAREVQK